MVNKIKKNYLLLVYTFLILYFFFNLLGGDRGLISYIEKKKLLETLKSKEFMLSNKIDRYELKNSLLTENLDLDYIETLIREKFIFGKKDEITYIIKK